MSSFHYRSHETNYPTSARIRRTLKRTWVGDWIVPRQFHAYGIGIERTGTTFLASLFRENYRAYHETEWYFLAEVFERQDELTEAEIRSWLQERDRTLRLEFEASHLLGPFVEDLVALFPEAKFILTVRHPVSWLQSVTNWAVNYDVLRPDGPWKPVMDRYYEAPTEDALHPSRWKENRLYTLDGYLSGWARHNRRVLEAVPEDRLLVVRTQDLSERLEDVSAFLGLNEVLSPHPRTDRNQNQSKQDFVGDVDEDELEARVETYCGDLIDDLSL